MEPAVCLSLLVGSQPSPGLSLTGPVFKIREQGENLLYKQVERVTQHHMHPQYILRHVYCTNNSFFNMCVYIHIYMYIYTVGV